MNTFVINEASYTSEKSINIILKNMMKILSKRIGQVYGPEFPFELEGTSKYGGSTKGILFIIDENKRFRINFVKRGDWIVQSVEFWEKMTLNPQFHYRTNNLSTIEILDLISGVYGGRTTNPENQLSKFSSVLINNSFDKITFSKSLSIIQEAKKDSNVFKNLLDVFLKEGQKNSFSSAGDFAQEFFSFWSDSKNSKKLKDLGSPKVAIGTGYNVAKQFKNEIPFSKVTKSNIGTVIGTKKASGSAISVEETEELKRFDEMYKSNQLTAKEKLSSIIDYAEQMIKNPEKHAMIVAGKSGIGKSFNLKKWAKEQGGYNEALHYKSGGLSEAAFISRLYEYRNSTLLFFDDCDDIFKLDANIWKAVLATEENRLMTIDKDMSGSPIMRDFIELQERGDDKKPLTVKRVIDGENITTDDIKDPDLKSAVVAYKKEKGKSGQILLNISGDAIMIGETSLITKFNPKVIMVTNLDMEKKLSEMGLKRRAYYVDLFISNKETAELVKEALPFISNKMTSNVPLKVKEELLTVIVERFYSSEVLSKAGRVVSFNFSNFLEALEIWINSAPKETKEKMLFGIFAVKMNR